MPKLQKETVFLRERLLALQIRYAIVMSMVSLLLGLTYRHYKELNHDTKEHYLLSC